MVKFQQPGGDKTKLSPGIRKSEKVKLIAMSGGAVLVFVAVLVSISQGRRARNQENGDLPAVENTPVEVAFRPEVDTELLEAVVRDAEGPDRVMLEPDAVRELMSAARQMPSSSYDDPTIGARELDAAVIDELAASPDPLRGEPFYVRGWIETIEERGAPGDGGKRFLGRLTLEDRSTAYFLVAEKPESMIFGDFTRVNGLFLKNFSDEDPENRGTWLDGPLLVGRELIRSYPSFGTVTELEPNEVAGITDDDLAGGISGIPFDALWHTLAYARDMEPGTIDWESAPLMTQAKLKELLDDPPAHRFEPYRIPISELMQLTVKRAGENPARIESYTEGWIGNMYWKGGLKFIAPVPHPELRLRDFVTARGLFFKNYAYEPLDGGMNVAPIFVLTDLEYYERPAGTALVHLGWVIGISSVGLLIFLSFLLSRDRRSANALQERLVQRRRSRRSVTA